MISQEEIIEFFEYKNNGLYWKKKTSNKSRISIGTRIGSICHQYRSVEFKGKRYLEHRLIWLLFYGYLPKEIDHINGIKDDNRIENLREVTHLQNQQNRKKIKQFTSKFKGVSWQKQTKKWRALIYNKGIQIYLGLFDSEIKAAKAYNDKAIELFGEFANLNIMESIMEEDIYLLGKPLKGGIGGDVAAWIYKSNISVDWDKILKEAAKKEPKINPLKIKYKEDKDV